MIAIIKGVEPAGLAELREEARQAGDTPKEAYQRLRNPLKKVVRASLLHEQGGLCAYCMRKIPPEGKEDVEELYTHIEHIIPRNPKDHRDVGQGLDYQNMVLTCDGGSHTATPSDNKGSAKTCDACKDDKEFQKINPTKADTLTSIYYTVDGIIKSDDAAVQHDLNEILNLNCPESPLIDARKKVLEALLDDISVADDMSELCQLYLAKFRAEKGEKTPFVGVLIWYLQELLASMEK